MSRKAFTYHFHPISDQGIILASDAEECQFRETAEERVYSFRVLVPQFESVDTKESNGALVGQLWLQLIAKL